MGGSVADAGDDGGELGGRRMGAMAAGHADCGAAGTRGEAAGRRAVRAGGGGSQPDERDVEAVLSPGASGAVVRISAAADLQFSERARVRVFLFLPVPGGGSGAREEMAGVAQGGGVGRGGGVHADDRAVAGVPGGTLSDGRAGGVCGGGGVDYGDSGGASLVGDGGYRRAAKEKSVDRPRCAMVCPTRQAAPPFMVKQNARWWGEAKEGLANPATLPDGTRAPAGLRRNGARGRGTRGSRRRARTHRNPATWCA